ncbi:F-box/RNI-like/FBD-like domains-containing protein [Rhynchospora pubera]|uniref:F-box/RNI-like/FBD-like domains-containing protein n=1 Tax=Rhynchospora pubera TaxID=906938 RepID=A0AAV8BUR2_9POAL|nr:F-box/RNI-like/FBD-like domains-containing protein [Rhynchospora pubera]
MMVTYSQNKKDEGDASTIDIISNLPECIKEIILVNLPIKEAVRTCILSKDWRRTWSKVQYLYINVGNEGSKLENTIKFIDQVLNLHNGNVTTLELSGVKPSEVDFERWMVKLSRMQIGKLILKLDCERNPMSRRSCQVTGHCAMKLPHGFSGFKLLHSLHFLGTCKINETDMAKLISSCPLLEDLFLDGFNYCALKIHALNLKKIWILGSFGDLYLQTPKLLKVFIAIMYYKKKVVIGSNLIQALSSISHIQTLTIYCQCPDPLIGSLKAKFPPILGNLIRLEIFLQPSSSPQLTFALLLFQNSPRLQAISLLLQPLQFPSISSTYEQLESSQPGLFPSLRYIHIKPAPGIDCSIAFAKFILKNAPALERLTIWENVQDSEASKLHELSATAEIVFNKHFSISSWY